MPNLSFKQNGAEIRSCLFSSASDLMEDGTDKVDVKRSDMIQ